VNTERGDVLAVENLLPGAAARKPAQPTKTEHWRRLLEPWLWTLRYAGLAALFAVVYFLILRPVKKQAMAAFRELPQKISAHNSSQTLAGPETLNALEQPGALLSGGQRTSELKKLLTDKVKAEPAASQPPGGILGARGAGQMTTPPPTGLRKAAI